MVFNSLEFLAFFLLVLACLHIVGRRLWARDAFLLVASYFFYAAWFWEYLLIIMFSTVLDWWLVRRMARSETERGRKVFLATSLIVNLGLLACFKYYNFFVASAAPALEVFGFDTSSLRHDLLLPVGISFYTFQTLSYTIDAYRRKIDPEPSLLRFALFVAFFPQLVAGPIVRAADFLPQLLEKSLVARAQVCAGAFLIFAGLAKKILIADSLALLGVDAVFEAPALYSALELWAGLYGYAFQIYCDFSGYSDIAIGLALVMGFTLPLNFNRPYLAMDPSDFWRRWHISLSTWLRDYLYLSLGGNRFGGLLTARNLMVTMLLGGLWHGAAWTFVLWGFMHGLYLLAYRPFRHMTPSTPVARFLAVALTFHLMVLTWLPFRAPDMATVIEFASRMFGVVPSAIGVGEVSLSILFFALVGLAAALHFWPAAQGRDRIRDWMIGRHLLIQGVIYAAMLVVFLGFSVGAPQFIYFQF